MSEKLFNLEISIFPKLVEIEEDVKKLTELYQFYFEFDNFLEKYRN